MNVRLREITDRASFRAWLEEGDAGAPLPRAAVQALDLREFEPLLETRSYEGSLFLDCAMSDLASGHVASTGGWVVPRTDRYAFALHCSQAYRVEDLYAGYDPADPASYERTPDVRIYLEMKAQGEGAHAPLDVTLARAIHDHSIEEALHDLIEGRAVVAVMGGHDMERSDPWYASIARVARALARDGYLVATGGGPGAMEAAHLGAYLAGRPDDALGEALALLAPRPPGAPAGKEYADPDWLERAWRVRDRFPPDPAAEARPTSVGVPTWHYGHEPPAPFATRLAKFFANSVREEGLLRIAKHGVVFAPGGAGTTQEIFQDATQNHYGTAEVISPMLLLGRDHWTRVRPVWPLLEAVARGQRYGELIALTDDEEELLARLRAYDPADWPA